MRVLVACECSGVVREAFRALGHDAYSCDLKPAEDSSPNHMQADVFSVLAGNTFDLLIHHWPCTRAANSGVLRLYRGGKKINGIDPLKWQEMEFGARQFRRLMDCNVPKICGENPIPHGYARAIMGDYQQTIQPFQFGEDASKATCLWLKGLPELVIDPAAYFPPRLVNGRPRWSNQTDSGQNKLAPGPQRATNRARTYPGIAAAMAAQWGTL